MSPSIISFPTNFFISLILILISTPQNAFATPSLIQTACPSGYKIFDTKLCLRVLQSIPSIVSAKDSFSILVAIIEAGILNSTNTRTHIESVLNPTNAEPRKKAAFRECKLSYDRVVGQFKGALEEARTRDFEAVSYDLLITSTDYIADCKRVVTSGKVKDEIVLKGNKMVTIFGISAYTVANQLSPRPPSHHH